jgi:hypothetical protein
LPLLVMFNSRYVQVRQFVHWLLKGKKFCFVKSQKFLRCAGRYLYYAIRCLEFVVSQSFLLDMYVVVSQSRVRDSIRTLHECTEPNPNPRDKWRDVSYIPGEPMGRSRNCTTSRWTKEKVESGPPSGGDGSSLPLQDREVHYAGKDRREKRS